MSNCLIYAVVQWVKRGGYVCFRRSRYWVGGFHVLWSRDLITFEDYIPIVHRRRILPPILFRGYVRKGLTQMEEMRGEVSSPNRK